MEEYKSEFDMSSLTMAENYTDDCCTCTICAQCGYRFHKSDDVVRVKQTGDVIHRGCFTDYADDSIGEMCDVLYF